MEPTRLALLATIGAVAFACGGKLVTSESTESSRSRQQGDPADRSDDEADPTSSSGSGPAVPDCVHEDGMGSSGGGPGYASCMTSERYTCSSGPKSIACECRTSSAGGWGEGSCTCGAETFAYDCATACTIPAAVYARCGLPPPAPPPPSSGGSSGAGGGSTSSSSG